MTSRKGCQKKPRSPRKQLWWFRRPLPLPPLRQRLLLPKWCQQKGMWDQSVLHNLHITPLCWETNPFGAAGCGHLQQEREPARWGDKKPQHRAHSGACHYPLFPRLKAVVPIARPHTSKNQPWNTMDGVCCSGSVSFYTLKHRRRRLCCCCGSNILTQGSFVLNIANLTLKT